VAAAPQHAQAVKSPEEVRAVGVVPTDHPPFHPPHHDVVEDTRGIEARLAGHTWEYSSHCPTCRRPQIYTEDTAGSPIIIPASRFPS
jgi:hypothetical protein